MSNKDTLAVKVGEEQKSFLMSVSLRNRLVTRVTGDSSDGSMGIVNAQMDPKTKEDIVLLVMFGKNATSKTLDDLDVVTPEVFDEIVDWAVDHVKDFFIQGLRKVKAMNAEIEKVSEELLPSSTGSTNLAPKSN